MNVAYRLLRFARGGELCLSNDICVNPQVINLNVIGWVSLVNRIHHANTTVAGLSAGALLTEDRRGQSQRPAKETALRVAGFESNRDAKRLEVVN